MRALTESEIGVLAQRKGVRRLAVENFLGTMAGLDRHQAMWNLALDQRSYSWNMPTFVAIMDGIKLAERVGG